MIVKSEIVVKHPFYGSGMANENNETRTAGHPDFSFTELALPFHLMVIQQNRLATIPIERMDAQK